jgi:hypothetical protein
MKRSNGYIKGSSFPAHRESRNEGWEKERNKNIVENTSNMANTIHA